MRDVVFRAFLATLLLCALPLAGCAEDPVTPGMGQLGPDAPVKRIGGRELVYPADMVKLGQQGFVSLDCTITRDGWTRDCVVIRATNRDFAQEARSFVAGARYRSAIKNGMPVEVAHHTFGISFRFPPDVTRLAYDCSITATGQARDCRDETPPGTISPALGALVLDRLQRLSMVVRREAGGATEEPHRRIDVLLTFESNPEQNICIPPLPAQVQVNLLLDCNARNVPQCREIADLPQSKDMAAQEEDEITRISVGFNGIRPPQAAAAD